LITAIGCCSAIFGGAVNGFLPRVWEVAEAIMAANRGIED